MDEEVFSRAALDEIIRQVSEKVWDACERQHLEYQQSVRSTYPTNPYRMTEENN